MVHLLVAAVAAASAIAPCAFAIVVDGSFKLESGGYDSFPLAEITKFSFAVGTSTIHGKFVYDTFNEEDMYTKSPALLLIDDGVWDKYHDNRHYPTCLDKVALSTMRIRIGQDSHVGEGHSGLKELNEVESLSIVDEGRTTFTFTWVIDQIDRTHGWFFVVADCALEQYQGEDVMDYRLELLNEGQSHASADEHGLMTIYIVSLVLLVAGGGCGVMLTHKHVSETEKNVHLVVQLLAIAYVLMLSGIVLESIHLWILSVRGYGITAFDWGSELLEMGSYLVIAFVLISLGSGWTLVDYKDNGVTSLLRDPKRMVKGFNAVVAGILTIVVASIVLIAVNKQSDGSFHKFHDFESPAGKLLLLIRLVLGALFAGSMVVTIRSMNYAKQLSDDVTLRRFLYSLLFSGTSYFVSFPASVYIAEQGLAHYHRHYFVEGSVILSQASMLLLLGYQFLSQSSVYRRLSTVWESGLLPTAGGLQSIQKSARD